MKRPQLIKGGQGRSTNDIRDAGWIGWLLIAAAVVFVMVMVMGGGR